MLPGHLFGATGAGDVKLFAAAGALIGPAPIVTAFFYTALAGGVLALIVARATAAAAADAERRGHARRNCCRELECHRRPARKQSLRLCAGYRSGNVDRRAGAVTQSPTGILIYGSYARVHGVRPRNHRRRRARLRHLQLHAAASGPDGVDPDPPGRGRRRGPRRRRRAAARGHPHHRLARQRRARRPRSAIRRTSSAAASCCR